jgi:hypothetical protein
MGVDNKAIEIVEWRDITEAGHDGVWARFVFRTRPVRRPETVLEHSYRVLASGTTLAELGIAGSRETGKLSAEVKAKILAAMREAAERHVVDHPHHELPPTGEIGLEPRDLRHFLGSE